MIGIVAHWIDNYLQTTIMRKLIILTLLAICQLCVYAQKQVSWDRYSLMIDGKRVVPVMGEIHYSRLPENEWKSEIQKMKEILF